MHHVRERSKDSPASVHHDNNHLAISIEYCMSYKWSGDFLPPLSIPVQVHATFPLNSHPTIYYQSAFEGQSVSRPSPPK